MTKQVDLVMSKGTVPNVTNAYHGQCFGGVLHTESGLISCLIVVNNERDLHFVADKLGIPSLNLDRVKPVAVVHENSFQHEDEEL